MNNAFDDWSGVRVFLAVMRRGSTLAASRDLGMSQPTVTRRIDAFEHRLGLTLFDRDTRGFRPTRDAQRLLPFAEAAEKAMTGLAEAAVAARRTMLEPIRITAPRLNFSPLFTAILAEFSALHPGVRFGLISSYALLDLAAGEADIAIRIARRVIDERLICSKLTDVTSTLFASRSYAEAHGLPRSDAEFAGHSFVVYDPSPSPDGLNAWLMKRISPDQIVSRSADAESVCAAIAAGLGIGPVPTSLAVDYPAMVPCFPPPQETTVQSWLCIAPDAWRRPEVKAFAAFFAPRFRAGYAAHKAEGERRWEEMDRQRRGSGGQMTA
ncbi:LysR family transcriptional regulator [Seohaeicola zhoushanensis]|uniref:LysR family transcriptional regulator n=1 Tax=Seohaeicola zhoushanensis TaxID=1569283 RepID=A0A8J3H0X6_9RHOB|nr:LysR family transcriptional regulator [Seohaeicola zhoushanensis]GHF60946.1 LysR family transcriptional regulator [Seohaeicola zhoushanensis]